MRFQVMGIDDGATELFETDSVDDAIRFVDRYVSSGDAGNWDLIEVYDLEFAEDPGLVTVYSWERESP